MNRTKEIEAVAAELGHTEAMSVSALDYIIETAKASVMVNQNNAELMAQVGRQSTYIDGLKCLAERYSCEVAKQARKQAWNEIHPLVEISTMTPTQCLNQIKADAGKDTARINWLSEKSTEKVIQNQSEYAALKTKYEIPTLVAYADFCGQIPFREAIDIAMGKHESTSKGDLLKP